MDETNARFQIIGQMFDAGLLVFKAGMEKFAAGMNEATTGICSPDENESGKLMYLPGFLERCTDWLNSTGTVGRVVSVRAETDEWVGGTEEGFRDEIAVTVEFTNDGRTAIRILDAREQEDLWRFVLGMKASG